MQLTVDLSQSASRVLELATATASIYTPADASTEAALAARVCALATRCRVEGEDFADALEVGVGGDADIAAIV